MSKPPGHREIANRLRDRIRDGEWKPGDELPTHHALSEEFHGAGRKTVMNALRLLNTRDQLVLSSRGERGVVREHRTITRVARYRPGRPALAADAAEADVDFESTITRTGAVAAPRAVAERLGVEEGSQVFRREREITVSGNVSQLATSYYPWDVYEAVPELGWRDTIEKGSHWALEAAGYQLTRFIERIEFRPASLEEARALELHEDGHVTSFTRLVFSGSSPVEFLDSVNPAMLYAFEYTYAPAGQRAAD